MLTTKTRTYYCHVFAVLVVLLPLSVSANEPPDCHHWSSSFDDQGIEGTIEAAFHPFFSFATDRDVTRCLTAGASPSSRTEEGWTPLHFAAAFSDYATVITLLEAGADLHARSGTGESPLHLAALNSTLDVTIALLEAGANVHARGQLGVTSLHIAASVNKNYRIIYALMKGGSDPNARMEDGETPLHVAAMANAEPTVIVALLASGSDPLAEDDADETPWDYANDNESLKGTMAYWCLNDARWRAMDGDNQRMQPLPTSCLMLTGVAEGASSQTPHIAVGTSDTESQPVGSDVRD
ncbi:MAG: ankyrin repeat domain-containing protein [Spirochaetaceae bacterium]|nr:ankyrin repeat domain-containing protein [Spirochaetaceae bacterium]